MQSKAFIRRFELNLITLQKQVLGAVKLTYLA